jgi:hypothetical protein
LQRIADRERLARALEATAKLINARPVQLIEALPVKQQVSEAPDHSGPFTPELPASIQKILASQLRCRETAPEDLE